jgi:CMP-N,N'-diacetyllegionaminic acid synthase
MKILGVIPARGGSKRIPKKNIKLLKGKPLISYTLETALASNISRVIVSTDCYQISKISKKYNVEVVTRPKYLANDNSTTLAVVQHVVNNIFENFDAVMTLQPTSPLRTVEDINNSIKIFKANRDADSLVSLVKVPHNYHSKKLMYLNGKYLKGKNKIEHKQNIKPMYARNGPAILITKTNKLRYYIFGGKILPYLMKKINSIDIDDMEDWLIAEKLI